MPADATTDTSAAAPHTKEVNENSGSENEDNKTVLDTPFTPQSVFRPVPDMFQLLNSYWAYRAGQATQTYGIPVIVPIGLAGNTLSLMVMVQRKNRHISSCMYMAALAVSDNGIMLCATYFWVMTEIWPDRRSLAKYYGLIKWECKTYYYIYTMFSVSSMCLVLAMTFTRFLAVTNPLKVKAISTVRTTKMTICAIFLFNICYAVPMALYSDILGSGLCVRLIVKATFSTIWSWVNICVTSLVPTALLLVMNTGIIVTMRRREKFLAKSTRGQGSNQINDRPAKSKSQENQLTKMLLLVAFALLILSMPNCSLYIILQLYNYERSLERYSYVFLFGHLSNKMYIANSAVNFFLYCIGGSKFRKNLVGIFQACCSGSKKPALKSSPSTSSSMIGYTSTGQGSLHGQRAKTCSLS